MCYGKAVGVHKCSVCLSKRKKKKIMKKKMQTKTTIFLIWHKC